MYQKAISLFLAMVALGLVSYGFTGFYALNDTQLFCSEDSDCVYSVCCPIYGESYGICDQEETCDEIYEAGRTAEEVTDNIAQQAASVEEQASQSYIAISLGIILLLIIAIVSFVESKQHRETKKKKKRKKSKK
tara:strand:- start:162 stop:563 length:402 start_codon:yes stop_codon:yes gene_type:complete